LDYRVAYSYAEEDTQDDTEFKYEYEDTLEYTFQGVTCDTPSVTAVSGDIGGLSSYELDEVEDADQIVEEKAWLLAANIKKELNTRLPVYLKSGFDMSLKNKTSDIEAYTNDETPEEFETLVGNTSGGRNAYASFPLIDKSLVDRFNSNRDAFAMELDEKGSIEEDYETDEKVYAGYLMGNLDFGKVNLLAGVRMEYTDLEATGYEVYEYKAEDGDNDFLTIAADTGTNDYTNVLPGVHVRANITDELIFHGAWTNTISRPNWEQTRNATTIEGDEEDSEVEISVGNPGLDPYEAMNFDATLSYYMPSVGMASIGAFYKDIDNFIYQQTHEIEYGDYEDATLEDWNNGDNGTIVGVELSYQQKLTFLPSPMDGFSIEGNLTLSDSEADVPATDEYEARTIDFIGQSDTVGSFALSFEKWDFFIRLSGTYRSEYLDELGEETYEDAYIDDHFQMDLSTACTIQEKYTVYANFININNEPLKAYWGESKMLKQYEEYGLSVRAGVKFSF
jgi:TonB-dependent receptor